MCHRVIFYICVYGKFISITVGDLKYLLNKLFFIFLKNADGYDYFMLIFRCKVSILFGYSLKNV